MSPNWNKIKVEYATGTLSYRKLAEKYNVSRVTLGARAKAEGWVELRRQSRDRMATKAIEKIADRQAEELAQINTLADGLLNKLQAAIVQLDMQVTSHKVEQEYNDRKETTEYMEASPGGMVDQKALRNLTAALKDLKEIKGIRSELDRQEQEARIANLRKQAKQEEKMDREITVTIMGEDDDYAG